MFKLATQPVPPGSLNGTIAPMPRLQPPPSPQPGGPAPGVQPNNPHPLQLPQGGLGGFMHDPLTHLGNAVKPYMPTQHALTAAATTNTPPLSQYTHHLGSFKGTADSLLGGVQSFVKDNPKGFAGLAGGLGAPLVKPLLSTPAGMPALTGLYGMLGGGTSAADAQAYFKPLTDKFT